MLILDQQLGAAHVNGSQVRKQKDRPKAVFLVFDTSAIKRDEAPVLLTPPIRHEAYAGEDHYHPPKPIKDAVVPPSVTLTS